MQHVIETLIYFSDVKNMIQKGWKTTGVHSSWKPGLADARSDGQHSIEATLDHGYRKSWLSVRCYTEKPTITSTNTIY